MKLDRWNPATLGLCRCTLEKGKEEQEVELWSHIVRRLELELWSLIYVLPRTLELELWSDASELYRCSSGVGAL